MEFRIWKLANSSAPVISTAVLTYKRMTFVICTNDCKIHHRGSISNEIPSNVLIIYQRVCHHLRFKRQGCFQAKLEDGPITMSIRGIISTSKAISGFPTTIQQLIRNLRLDSPFGTVDHSLNEKPLPTVPRKRSRSVIQEDRRNPKRACSSVYGT